MGSLFKAVGQYKAGRERKRSLDDQATQLRRNAQVRRAVSHREAADERQLSDLIQSKALAAAAASGAGVTNPNMVRILGDLDAEGEYRALSRLFAGENEAEGMEAEAANLNKAGKAAEFGGKVAAVATILTGDDVSFSSMYGGSSKGAGTKTGSSSGGKNYGGSFGTI